MKKIFHLGIVLAFLLALVPVSTLAHTEGDPFVTDLIAGQNEDVGDVMVWNDADYLYVEFSATGEWCIMETHVHVATSPGGIPQKNGNPIPGQFAYKTYHGIEPCVTEYTYTIPLEWDFEKELYIAAHAAVFSLVDGCYETVWQIGDVEEDPNDSLSLSDEFAGNDLGPVVEYAIPPNDYGSYFPVAFVPLNYYPDYPWAKPGAEYFAHTVNINYTADLSFGGQLSWRWTAGHNGEEEYDVIWNSDVLGSFADWGLASPNEGFYTHQLSVPSYDGDQAISFARTDYWYGSGDGDGGRWDWIKLEKPCVEEETAWGEGAPFDGNNWGMYFTYILQEPCTNVPEVINGGFEYPVPQTSQGWDIYDSGTDGLGWTVEWYDGSTSYGGWTRPEPAHLEIHKSGVVVSAYEKNQYAELDTDWDGPGGGLNGEPASIRIYQDLNTCPGEEYTLKYAWRGRPGYTSALQVNFGDYSAAHSDNSGQWNVVKVTATASGLTTVLEFIETGPADSFGMFLDAVSVTPCNGSCTP